MKKVIAGSLFIMLVAVHGAFAMTPEEQKKAQYQEMKKIKDAQREARANKKANAVSTPKAETFWDREAKRSGLSETGSGMGQWVHNLNPVPFFKDQQEKYNARKSAIAK